jgi:uncharacterized protein (DUF2267 family)
MDSIDVVRDALATDRDAAERVTRTVLGVLGTRIGKDEGRKLAAYLPGDVAAELHSDRPAQPFDAEEFVRRIDPSDLDGAERAAVAVFAALARFLPAEEYEHLVTRLSKDYAPLLPKAPVPDPLSAQEFLARVGRRLDPSVAWPATQATLETLAERIAPGDVRDLMARLPVRFHGPLKRGAARATDATRRMPPEDFIRRLAERAGVSEERAREYTRAVLTTLREAVRDEFFDVTVQLPGSYWDLVHTGR